MRILCLLLVFIAQSLSAEIRTITRIAEFETAACECPHILVLADVDDTLLRSKVSLGWGPWWNHGTQFLKSAKLDLQDVQPILNPMIGWIFQHLPLEPMEPDTSAVMARLQEKKIPVLGLTARRKSAPYCTHFDRVTRDHLETVGIDFTQSSLPPQVDLEEVDFELWAFSYGVIFSNQNLKGPSLRAFLKYFEWRPERIVFIDDRLEMLQSVDQAMAEEGIPFLGFHYVRPERAFDPAVANVQWHALWTTGAIPSDEAAQSLVEQNHERSPNFFLEHIVDHLKTVTNADVQQFPEKDSLGL